MSDWRKTIKEDAPKSWRDTIADEPEAVSMGESAARGASQGLTFDLGDEIVGAVGAIPALFDKDKSYVDSYRELRDIDRESNDAAREANPGVYNTSEIASSLIVPGGIGKTAAKKVGIAAAQSGLTGFGQSTATNASDLAEDTGMGAGLGLLFGTAGEKVLSPAAKKLAESQALQKLAGNVGSMAKSGLTKAGSFLSGVDEDATKRMMSRPMQTAAAEADDFAYDVGQRAVKEADKRGDELGNAVGNAETSLLNRAGKQSIPEGQFLADDIESFLERNAKSERGFSAITDSERKTLEEIRNMIVSGPMAVEDLVKYRKHLDHTEDLAKKYNNDGVGPFFNFLKGSRHNADSLVDTLDDGVNTANKNFSQYKDDMSALTSAGNENRAEAMINNLYGANKTRQQGAAGRLFSSDTLDQAKDIASNKAFDTAARPGGDNYFRRGALAVLTAGTSEVVTNPQIWKKGLRGAGRIEQALKLAPDRLGKYTSVLSEAAKRGNTSLSATHFVLSQRDPEYRKTLEQLDDEDAK